MDASTFTLSDSGKVTQSQAIAATNLDLLGADGNYNLTNTRNKIATLAADTRSLNLTDSTALRFGKVDTIRGVTATTLALNDVAGVKQAEPITSENVLLEGTGGVFSLINPANTIGKLATDTKTLRLADSSSLEIGTAHGVSGLTATTVSLSDPATVTQSQPSPPRICFSKEQGEPSR